MLLDDGKTDRVVLARGSGFEASQEAITEYRVLGPMINGCSWLELRPITSRKHQVHLVFSYHSLLKIFVCVSLFLIKYLSSNSYVYTVLKLLVLQ